MMKLSGVGSWSEVVEVDEGKDSSVWKGKCGVEIVRCVGSRARIFA